MTSISKNSTITFSSQIVASVLGIIIMIILARALGPTGKGIYVLTILILEIMSHLGSLGIGAANVYFTGSKKYEIRDIVSNSLFSTIILSLIIISLFFGIFHLRIFQDFVNTNQINLFYLWLVVLTIPLALLFRFFNNILLGKEDILEYNKANILLRALQLVATIIFLLLLRQGVFGAILAYILSVIGAVLFVMLSIKKATKLHISFNKNLFKDSVKYGLKAYIGNLAQFLNYRIDMFLVAVFLVPAAVGFYNIAVGVAERLLMIPGAIAIVLFPKISSLQDSRANVLTPKVCRHTFFILLVLSLVITLLAKFLINVFFGPAFLPSAIPLLILLPGIVSLSIWKILASDLGGRGKPGIYGVSAFLSLIVNIVLNLLLIPKWGISGAALASTISYIIAAVVVLIGFMKISKNSLFDTIVIKSRDFMDYRKILKKGWVLVFGKTEGAL